MSDQRCLTIHFNDGSSLRFGFPEQGPNAAARQLKIEQFMSSQHLVLEVDGEVLVFPVTSVKYIALSGMSGGAGAGSGLPKHAIVGARRLD